MSKRFNPAFPRMAFKSIPVPERDEHGITVRLGRKWMDSIQNGDHTIVALNEDGKPVRLLTVDFVAYMALDDLPAGWLPGGLTHEALRSSMSGAYGKTVHSDEYVTVIRYIAS